MVSVTGTLWTASTFVVHINIYIYTYIYIHIYITIENFTVWEWQKKTHSGVNLNNGNSFNIDSWILKPGAKKLKHLIKELKFEVTGLNQPYSSLPHPVKKSQVNVGWLDRKNHYWKISSQIKHTVIPIALLTSFHLK